MLYVNKIAFLLLSLVGMPLFAGSMGAACETGQPCSDSAWTFGVKALYLQPYYGNQSLFPTIKRNEFGAERVVKNTPNQAWGVMLEGGYSLNALNDIELNWTHLLNKQTIVHFHEGFYQPPMALANGFIGPIPHQLTTLTIKPNWDVVNLDLAHRVAITSSMNLRYLIGAQYAGIKTTATQTTLDLSNQVIPAPSRGSIVFVGTTSASTAFNGAGPRLAMEAGYDCLSGLSLYANAGVAALMGSKQFNIVYMNSLLTSSDGMVINPYPTLTRTRFNRSAVIPELEAKAGLSYTYLAQGQWTLDLGWLWAAYYHAQLSSNLTGPLSTLNTSVGIHGPYAGLKWVGSFT